MDPPAQIEESAKVGDGIIIGVTHKWVTFPDLKYRYDNTFTRWGTSRIRAQRWSEVAAHPLKLYGLNSS